MDDFLEKIFVPAFHEGMLVDGTVTFAAVYNNSLSLANQDWALSISSATFHAGAKAIRLACRLNGPGTAAGCAAFANGLKYVGRKHVVGYKTYVADFIQGSLNGVGYELIGSSLVKMIPHLLPYKSTLEIVSILAAETSDVVVKEWSTGSSYYDVSMAVVKITPPIVVNLMVAGASETIILTACAGATSIALPACYLTGVAASAGAGVLIQKGYAYLWASLKFIIGASIDEGYMPEMCLPTAGQTYTAPKNELCDSIAVLGSGIYQAAQGLGSILSGLCPLCDIDEEYGL